jgi:hypothetical protein
LGSLRQRIRNAHEGAGELTMAQPDLKKAVAGWLESCQRKGNVARNTVVVGIVALEYLRRTCPVTREQVFSHTGGEVRGAGSTVPQIYHT